MVFIGLRFIFSRIQSESILSNMTKFGVAHFEKGYAEMDRKLFLVLTAIQVCEELSENSVLLGCKCCYL